MALGKYRQKRFYGHSFFDVKTKKKDEEDTKSMGEE